MKPEQKQLIREKFEKGFETMNYRGAVSRDAITDFWLNEIDLAIKQTEERIEKGVEMLTHYYRSKYSPDCSRGETEEEKSTEMLEKQDIITLITNK